MIQSPDYRSMFTDHHHHRLLSILHKRDVASNSEIALKSVYFSSSAAIVSLDPEGERYRGLELVEPRRVLRLSMPRQIDGDAMQVN